MRARVPSSAPPAGRASPRVRKALPTAAGLVLRRVDQLVGHPFLRRRRETLALHGGDLVALPSAGSGLLILPGAAAPSRPA